jgi:hypothetical protein
LSFVGSFAVTRLLFASLFAMTLAHDVQAQKLVDPAKVAPEFREAAEQRRAEQLKQMACAKKADEEKVMPRERVTYLTHCLEADAAQ